jgi:hypothetical protein
MTLRTTLEEVVEMARDEARLSSSSARGVDHRNMIVRLVKRIYEQMLNEYDWMHLQVRREDAGKILQAGQRYYDFPATLDYGSIKKVWRPVEFGIRPQDYSIVDSDQDERRDPVERWDYRSDRQFEVWPIPTVNGEEIRFEGKLKVEPLTEDASRLLLDDQMIALYAAAEILMGNGADKLASLKIEAARSIMNRQRARNASQARVRIGLESDNRNDRYYPRSIDQVN